MNQITIRKATLEDMETLLLFEQGVILAERPFDSTIKDGHIHYYNLEEFISAPHIELLVAETDGQIIASGYARIEKGRHYLKHEKHAYLGFMYVVPEYRGKGVNQIIIQALKEWSIGQNMTELRLDVYCENHGAIKAYQKAGFSKHMVQMRMGLEEGNN